MNADVAEGVTGGRPFEDFRGNLERLLQELGRSSKFITVYYGVVDTASRRLTYVRAGHDLPILLRAGEVHQLRGEGLPLGFPDMVRGGSGDFSGGVSWQGSPLAIDLPSLTGELRLDIGKGQFLRTEPGIAKLIGVLNLQSLPRRLNFDFRDVFAQGFAFDEIRGGAALLRGVASTEDLQMNGLQARVNLRGTVDLVRETQSLLVAVQPQVDAGLASLAYAAMVNPAVGIGSFIAQWMLQKPLASMLATEFEVEGDWSDPQVRQRAREAPAQPDPTEGLMLQ